MRTVKIDIINEKVINQLKELEALNLIRFHKEKNDEEPTVDWSKFKGAMTKQSKEDIDDQFDEIRAEWE